MGDHNSTTMTKHLVIAGIAFVTIMATLLPIHLPSSDSTDYVNIVSAQQPPQDLATAASAGSRPSSDNGDGSCGVIWRGSFRGCVADAMNGLLSLSGLFTWLGGVALNTAVVETVFKMGSWVNQAQTIQIAWETLRDVANIGLIFGLLAIAIATILQIHSYSARELLAKLLIVALVINFSFFVTKAIIDVGNGVATLSYRYLTQSSVSAGCRDTSDACLSDNFMNTMRLQTIYRVSQDNTTPGSIQQARDQNRTAQDVGSTQTLNGRMSWGVIFTVGFFGSLFLIIAGFVFLAATILLCIRFVILVLLMILSPVAWAASILPATKGLSHQWWSALWKEVFFAPALFLMLGITLNIASMQSFRGNQASFYDLLANANTGAAVLLIHFAIIIGFLIASMVIARKIGSYGSGAVVGKFQGWGKKLSANAWKYTRQGAGGATFGLGGRIMRRTVGQAGYNYAESDAAQKLAAQGGIKGVMGRALLGTARTASKSSFDARKIGGIGKTLGIGMGQTGGRAKQIEDKTKKLASYGRGLGKSAEAYATNVLESSQFGMGESRTVLSAVFGTTNARRAAAKKLTEKGKLKKSRAEYNKKERGLDREIQAQQAVLNNPSAPNSEKSAARSAIERLEEELIKLQEQKEELKEKFEKEKKDSEAKPEKKGSDKKEDKKESDH